jgi:golgi phosphoprotein 3
MDPAESGRALAALGEDLFVLSIRRRDGKLLARSRIDLALMGSELVRLAAAGRVRITEGRIEVVDQTATGDPELDAALLSLIAAPFPPRPVTWVGLPRPGIRDAYAARLVSARVLRVEAARRLGASRYHLAGSPRVAEARSRLDAITAAAGPPADSAQAALGGLACAIGLGGALYPGREGRDRRARMGELARQEVIAHTTAAMSIGSGRGAPAGPRGGAGPAAAGAAREAAGSREGAEGDADLAVMAGTQDAVAAAVHAVTAVVDSGAVIGSQIMAAQGGPVDNPPGQGGDERHGGGHGHGFGGFGGFGRH